MPKLNGQCCYLVAPPAAASDWIDPTIQFRANSLPETKFAHLWAATYPELDLHYELQFAHPRRFTFDFASVQAKVAVEIQGGVWIEKSGHNSGNGLRSDYEKAKLAAEFGWVLLPITAEQVECGDTLGRIAKVIKGRM
jgi:very-short-patch-repair endonuclease